MRFLVHGIDATDAGDRLEALAPDHWAYMDGFADALVARGPTLTADGSTHTGSIHVIEAINLDSARRFAREEPFCRAGLYSSVEVTRMQSLLDSTMWDRPAAGDHVVSTLIVATWPSGPRPADDSARGRVITALAADERLVFGGVLVTDDGRAAFGVVAGLDVDTETATRLVGPIVDHGEVRACRWRRGGRPAPTAAED